MRILLIATLASFSVTAALAADGPPWGAFQHATVIERSLGVAGKSDYEVEYQLIYGVDPDTRRLTLKFGEVKPRMYNGLPWNPGLGMPFPMFQPNLLLAPDGSIAGIVDEETLRREYIARLDKLIEAGGPEEPAARMLREPGAVQQFFDGASDRYCHWMCGVLQAPKKNGERREGTQSRAIAGADLEVKRAAWREDDPQDQQLLRAHVDVAAAAKRGGDDARTTMHQHVVSTLDRTSLLPLKVEVVNEAEGAKPARISYVFRWDSLGPPEPAAHSKE